MVPAEGECACALEARAWEKGLQAWVPVVWFPPSVFLAQAMLTRTTGMSLRTVGSFPAKHCSLARLNSGISVARILIPAENIKTPAGCNTD